MQSHLSARDSPKTNPPTSNRIIAVRSQGSVAPPPGATVIDVTGKTILPGFLDIHYHVRPPDDIHPTQQWNLQTHLAYGVTTIRDPHNNSMDLLAYAERERLGRLDSPRIFTTLLPLYHFQSARPRVGEIECATLCRVLPHGTY